MMKLLGALGDATSFNRNAKQETKEDAETLYQLHGGMRGPSGGLSVGP